MNKPGLSALLFLLVVLKVSAIENHKAGARSLALSDAFISVSDVWGTFHNQATLARLTTFSSAVFYESRFMVDELSHTAGTVVLPAKPGTFGFSFSQFGHGTYKEHKIGLAFARMLGKKLAASAQLDYFSERFPENESAHGFVTFEAGVVYDVNEELFLGAHVFNPISAGIKTSEGEQKLPVSFRFGGHYQLPTMVMFAFEAEKDIENPLVIKTGIEFSPAKSLALRFGVSGKPMHYNAGFGYHTGRWGADFGFAYHGNLGVTPSVSIKFGL